MTETEIDIKEWKKQHDRHGKILLAMGVVGWGMVLVMIYMFGYMAGRLSTIAATVGL